MALRDTMRESVAPYLPAWRAGADGGRRPDREPVPIFFGLLPFYLINRCRMLAVTPQRILVLDTGRFSWKKARGVVTELPRPTRLGPGSGVWHVIPVGQEKLRVHRRFFKDLQTADSTLDQA
ncbi:MAG: hypothetical protein ACXVZW_09695 [Gaiellaceae bacterium]